MDRPIVGIANTYCDYNPCHGNVPQLIEAAKRGVMLAGALPMVFPTMSIHESFASPTSMYLRNLMAMETEEMIRAQPMDAVVLIGGCDKTLPAQIMAAASSEIPAIFLPTGPMAVGHHKGERLGACTDCRRFWGRFRAGEIDEAEIAEVNNKLVEFGRHLHGDGHGKHHGEPDRGDGSLPAACGLGAGRPNAERVRLAEETGRIAARTCGEPGAPTVRDILTRDGTAQWPRRAAGDGRLDQRRRPSCRHRRPARHRARPRPNSTGSAGASRCWSTFKPSGQHYMEQFHEAGGVPTLLKAVRHEIDDNRATVYGKTIGEMIDSAPRRAGPDHHPHGRSTAEADRHALPSSTATLPRAAPSSSSRPPPKPLMQHRGRAVVFEFGRGHDAAASTATTSTSSADDILVLRNAGPKGAPGMPEAGYLPIPRKLARQGVKDMVRISDARMSGTAFGTIILHIAPEAAAGGPLAIVRTGDRIRLDVAARRIDLEIDQCRVRSAHGELDSASTAEPPRGYAQLYHRHVLQADEGARFRLPAA